MNIEFVLITRNFGLGWLKMCFRIFFCPEFPTLLLCSTFEGECFYVIASIGLGFRLCAERWFLDLFLKSFSPKLFLLWHWHFTDAVIRNTFIIWKILLSLLHSKFEGYSKWNAQLFAYLFENLSQIIVYASAIHIFAFFIILYFSKFLNC